MVARHILSQLFGAHQEFPCETALNLHSPLSFLNLRLWLLLLLVYLIEFGHFFFSLLVKHKRMNRLLVLSDKLDELIWLKPVEIKIKAGILNELTPTHGFL